MSLPHHEILKNPRFAEIIDLYRDSIRKRYSQSNLKKFPNTEYISPEKVEELIQYFLILLYPPYEERLKLDLAFQSLSSFVHSPSKLWGILGSIGTAFFTLGRDLGGAFRAGIAALQSYLNANRLERELYQNAIPIWESNHSLQSVEDLEKLMKSIPPEVADAFREEIVQLFRCLGDRPLLIKITKIMERILHGMKKKPKVYDQNDVAGIEIGLSILHRGFVMFDKLSPKEIQIILDTIDSVERNYFHEVVLRS